MKKYKILFISTAVGPLGSGEGGGVETSIINLTPVLVSRGHKVDVIAPLGSKKFSPKVGLILVSGMVTKSAIGASRDFKTKYNSNGVLEKMWQKAKAIEDNYDIIIGDNYDWQAFKASLEFKTPVLHTISMASLVNYTDKNIKEFYVKYPKRVSFYSKAQAETFGLKNINKAQILGGGVNLSNYKFNLKPKQKLVFSARISKEKGLEDAFEVAERLNMELDICGKIQDRKYFQTVSKFYPSVKFNYHGFLKLKQLAKVLGQATVFLSPHKWVEAFGYSLIEAMACGTPVVAYNLGGPKEIIKNGQNGFLVEKNNVKKMADAVIKASKLDRLAVSKTVLKYSYKNLAKKYEVWIGKAI